MPDFLAGLVAASASDKARGSARYTRDLFGQEGVVAGVVESPHAHALIESLDTSAARSVPGVLAVLTGADFGDFRLGREIADQPVLAPGTVRYVGEPVAAVAATSAEALSRGLAAIEVGYRPLPAAVTWPEALSGNVLIHAGAPGNVARTYRFEHGDPAAIGDVEITVEDTFRVAPVQHAYMEPYAVWCHFDERAGAVELHAATHSPFHVIDEYLGWFERFPERLILRTPTIGGAFGAKYEHPLHLICAEFSRRLRRDIGLVLPRMSDFRIANSRADTELRVRIGATRDGRLVSKQTSVVMDNGAYSLHGPSVLLAALQRSDNLYRYRHTAGVGRLVYTNTPPTQCYRGFGDPEGAFAQEQLLDELASRLDLSPAELRRRNATGPGDTTVHGWQIGSCQFTDCLDAVDEAVEKDRDRHLASRGGQLSAAPGERDDGGPPGLLLDVELDGITSSERYATGWGIAGSMHVVSNRQGEAPDEARVRLQCTPGGLVIWSGEVDVGCGTPRVLAGLAARALGVPEADVRVVLGDSAACPPGDGSYASRTVFFAGDALLDACRQLEERRRSLAGDLGIGEQEPPGWQALAEAAARRGRSAELDVTGHYVSARSEPYGPTGDGNRSPAYSFAVHGCRVRVDRWTGAVEVQRYWTMHDVGQVLLRPGAEGQVRGGVTQGLGHALTERVVRGTDGRMLNDGFLDYRLPTSRDVVPIEVGFTAGSDGDGPFGAKAVAELPMIPVAACVANAVRDATGARVATMPLEPEVVRAALMARRGPKKEAGTVAR